MFAIQTKGVDLEMPDFDEFCLVVVIGARERRLRDDFAILKLQSPWNSGEILVFHCLIFIFDQLRSCSFEDPGVWKGYEKTMGLGVQMPFCAS